MRKIIHIDMDAFFASVEQRDHPELRGKPIAVGGSEKRGVVAAASYEARKFGVRSAMPGALAARMCPNLIFVKHRFDVYREVSSKIRDIFHEYTDLVEPLSLDEAFLDVTEPKKGPPSGTLLAQEIRERIYNETQLTASAGVSFNKFLAKIASDINKPNGMKVILPQEAEEFVENLPIERFFGIGKVTAERMHKLGISKGIDLKSYTELELVQKFGKVGRYYYKICRAIDDRPVEPNRIRKSIGAERTFESDLDDIKDLLERLTPIAEKVFDYMTNKDNFGRTISLKIKTAEFQTLTRSRTFPSEVTDRDTFLSIVHELLLTNQGDFDAVRLLGVSVSNLSKEDKSENEQLILDFDL